MRTSPRHALVALVLAVALVGCGGSSGDDSADPTTTKPRSGESTTTAAEASTSTTSGSTTKPTGESVATTVAAEGDPGLCEPLTVITDFDAQTTKLVNTGDWPTIQKYYVEHTDEMVAAYDEAIALDSDLTADLKSLRAVTASSDELAAQSKSLTEFGTKLSALPGLMAASSAAGRVLQFTQENCPS